MFNPIEDKKVYEQIVDQIKDMIYQGKLKKGDKLPSERALTDAMKVSRASIREAFSALEMIGLIECRHGEGTFIREDFGEYFLKPLSLFFMLENNMEEEFVELRRMIEISGAGMAAWRAKQEDLEALGRCVQMMEDNKGDEELSHYADREFHYTLARATGNRLVYQLLTSMSEIIDIFLGNIMKKIIKDDNKNEIWIRQHRKIYEAVRKGDAELAQQAVEEHLRWAEDLLR